jgi:type IV pilus assembly protein PilV
MTGRCRQRRRRGGFSLIEVLIALTILGLGLLALAGAQIKAIEGGRNGRHLSQAAVIAQSELEQLQRERWTNIAPTDWTADEQVAQVVQGAVDHNEQIYFKSRRIADLVLGRTRTIDVRVTWSEPNRPLRSAIFSSIRYNREGL